MITHILFDLDGTLADTAPDLSNALNATRMRYDLPALSLDKIRDQVSLGAESLLKKAFDHETPPYSNDIHRQFLEHYAQNICEKTCLFDGIEEVLTTIEASHKPWGIVTNKATHLTEPLLKALGLDQRAACVVCGDTLAYKKPHPAPILHACQLIQADPASTLYIGDTKTDIEAGKKAGTKTLIALYGYIDDGQNPEDWQADGMVSRPIEITQKLSEL